MSNLLRGFDGNCFELLCEGFHLYIACHIFRRGKNADESKCKRNGQGQIPILKRKAVDMIHTASVCRDWRGQVKDL